MIVNNYSENVQARIGPTDRQTDVNPKIPKEFSSARNVQICLNPEIHLLVHNMFSLYLYEKTELF